MLILCAVVCTLGNMYADPSLNTPENNARIIDEVKKGLNHGHGGHGHSHGDGKPCPHAHGGHEEHAHEGHGHGAAHEGHEHEKRDAHEGHGHAHKEHVHDHEGHGHTHGSGDSCCIWTKALGATLLISGAPFLILYLIPIEKKNDKQDKLLKVLLAFASGGLLGDAFLHLIPHAISPHSHGEEGHGHSHHEPSGSGGSGGHGHSHGAEMTVGLWTLGGLLTFLLVEKLVMAVKGGGGHSHSHGPVAPKAKKEKNSDDEGEKEEEKAVCEEVPEIKVSAYLNMAADMAHNFTDGLAIGSSFLVSEKMGWMTTMLILIHEVPHEIGDFAILVQSGFTKKDAMNFQLVTALGALLGTATSVMAGGLLESATQSILPFTAGGFIYIATVSVIPELLSGDSSLWQGVKEILALVTGIALMVVIAEYE